MTHSPPHPSEFLLWQLVDSTFPMGGLAHSGGLEAAVHYGQIPDPEALRGFIRQALWQGVYGVIPFANTVYRCPADYFEVDARCDAYLSNHVARRASSMQGQALLASGQQIFQLAALTELRQRGRAEQRSLHFAPTLGFLTRVLNLRRDELVRGGIFMLLRALLNSAVRLGVIGPLESQRMQYTLADELGEMTQRAQDITLEDLAQTAPLLELMQAGQDRLYSRLFQS